MIFVHFNFFPTNLRDKKGGKLVARARGSFLRYALFQLWLNWPKNTLTRPQVGQELTSYLPSLFWNRSRVQ